MSHPEAGAYNVVLFWRIKYLCFWNVDWWLFVVWIRVMLIYMIWFLGGYITSLNGTLLCVFIKTFIFSSMKQPRPSNLVKVCSHWQRRVVYLNIRFWVFSHRNKNCLSECVCVCVCVLTAARWPWRNKETTTTKMGNAGGTDQTTSLLLHTHTKTHISVRPVPALQPSTLRGTLELKTHSWRMYHFFLCVCFSVCV